MVVAGTKNSGTLEAPPIDESTCAKRVVGILTNFNPLLKILAAKPETSPTMPPPKDIMQSFLLKLNLKSLFNIEFTFFKFLEEWPEKIFIPSFFSLFVLLLFNKSLPCILKPCENKTSAIPDIPMPPIPTKCIIFLIFFSNIFTNLF